MAVHVAEVDFPSRIRPPDARGAFALDSSDEGPGTGRWTVLGAEPRVRVTWEDAGPVIEGTDALPAGLGPLETLRAAMEWFAAPAATERAAQSDEAAGLPFIGGAVGYFSYEFARHFEHIPVPESDPVGVPDFNFGFFGGAVLIDRFEKKAWAVGIDTPFGTAAEEASRAADRALVESQKADDTASGFILHSGDTDKSSPHLQLPDTARYHASVQRARDYIAAGDVYQVNLTGTLVAEAPLDPFKLWSQLVTETPAPFTAYFDGGDHVVLSASPERFLKVTGRDVETRPIKGTRPRGATAAADVLLLEDLERSAKDRAELLMIVDLHRNDLGRVCDYGSIRVPTLFGVRTFSAVHHLEATITGRLSPGYDRWDLIAAAFPAGSITGAPKIRAMEIIAELEQRRRGVYCGAIGYLDVRGDCDLSVAIRTAVVKGTRVHYGAGGGIVWDSDPAAEYEELIVKGRPFFRMLGLADETARRG